MLLLDWPPVEVIQDQVLRWPFFLVQNIMKVTNGPVNDGSVDWIKNTTVKCTFLLFKEKINVDFYSFEVAKDWSSEGYKVNLYINLVVVSSGQ